MSGGVVVNKMKWFSDENGIQGIRTLMDDLFWGCLSVQELIDMTLSVFCSVVMSDWLSLMD